MLQFNYEQVIKDYDILKVTLGEQFSVVKRKYHQLALQYHPDKNISKTASDEFTTISNAYQYINTYQDEIQKHKDQILRVAAAPKLETQQQEEMSRQRKMREEAARQEATRQEFLRQEAAREAVRREALRQEAARQEAARREIQRQEAARQDAVRREVLRQEAVQKEAARQEALRQEAARREIQRQEAARQEAVRREVLRQEAAREETARREVPRKPPVLYYLNLPSNLETQELIEKIEYLPAKTGDLAICALNEIQEHLLKTPTEEILKLPNLQILLVHAARQGFFDIVQKLQTVAGKKIQECKETAFREAGLNRHLNIVKYLLETEGANIEEFHKYVIITCAKRKKDFVYVNQLEELFDTINPNKNNSYKNLFKNH